ncbi:MAG TPA: hypothetical protein VFX17_00215 [Patescibacteria group bacterium]|nr:hypothetical protein [Patescibacteria group bacterium]
MNDSTIQKPNPIKFAILCLLALLLVVTATAAFFAGRTRAQNQIRLSEVALIQKFLEAYKLDNGYYPAAVNNQPSSFQKYLSSLPVPASDSKCGSANQYIYEQLNSGSSYKLSFCLNSKTEGFSAGINSFGPPAN